MVNMKKRKLLSISLLMALCMLASISLITPIMADSYPGTLVAQNNLVWYRFSVSNGAPVQLSLTFSATNDFDFYLSISILTVQNMAGRTIPDSDIAHSINSSGGYEEIKYTNRLAGILFVAVHSHSGSGTYMLTSNIPLQQFDPILEIIMWVVIIIVIVSVSVVGVWFVRRWRRKRSESVVDFQ